MTYAGFWKRVAAALIDGIVLYIISLALGAIFGGVLFTLVGLQELSSTAADDDTFIYLTFAVMSLVYIVSIVAQWLYFALMESSTKQGTLGKMALGIKVTDLNGERIGFGKATGRYFSKIISAFIFMIGFLMVAFTGKKQGLHDIIADCLVINKNSNGQE